MPVDPSIILLRRQRSVIPPFDDRDVMYNAPQIGDPMKTAPVGVSRGACLCCFAWLTTCLFNAVRMWWRHVHPRRLPRLPRPRRPGIQPRLFPGDFFMRLPTAASDGTIPAAVSTRHLKRFFVSDPNFNSVEVYSTVDGHKVGEVSIPACGLGSRRIFLALCRHDHA